MAGSLPDLRWNNIGLLGGRALADCLPSNRTLRRMELAGNSIPGDVLRAVGTARCPADMGNWHECGPRAGWVLDTNCGWQFRGPSRAWGYWGPRGSRGSRFQVILPTPGVGPLPAAPTSQDGTCGCFSEIRRHLQGVVLRHRSGPSRTSKRSFPMWPLGLGIATVPQDGTRFLTPPRTPQGVLSTPLWPLSPSTARHLSWA